MSCDAGQHGFKPFPRSKDLFCPYCGDTVRAADVRADQQPSAEAAALARVAELVDEGRQQRLPLEATAADPEADRARDIVGDRRALRENAQFEAAVEQVILDADPPLDEASATEIRAQALAFGPTLELDSLRDVVNGAAARPDRVPAGDDRV